MILTTQIIYFAIVTVVVLFAGVTLLLKYTGKIGTDNLGQTEVFRYASIILAPLGAFAGTFVYRRQLFDMDRSLSLRAKFNKFQGAMLMRAACVEIPALFSVIGTFLTGDESFLLVTAIMIGLFFFWRPTLAGIAEDLQLSPEERRKLEDPEGMME